MCDSKIKVKDWTLMIQIPVFHPAFKFPSNLFVLCTQSNKKQQPTFLKDFHILQHMIHFYSNAFTPTFNGLISSAVYTHLRVATQLSALAV